jgi:hypothetical protein
MEIDVNFNFSSVGLRGRPETHISAGPRRGVEMVLFSLMRGVSNGTFAATEREMSVYVIAYSRGLDR